MTAFAVASSCRSMRCSHFSIRGKGELAGTITFEYYQELFRDEDLRQAIFSSLRWRC